MDEGGDIRMDDGAGRPKGLAELEERRSKVEVLQAGLDEGAAGRRQGSQVTRQAGNEAVRQENRQAGDNICRQVGDKVGTYLLNWNEAVFISLDLKTAGEEVVVVHILEEISRLDLVQHKNEEGGACRRSARRDRRRPGSRRGAGRWRRAATRAERWHICVGRRAAG